MQTASFPSKNGAQQFSTAATNLFLKRSPPPRDCSIFLFTSSVFAAYLIRETSTSKILDHCLEIAKPKLQLDVEWPCCIIATATERETRRGSVIANIRETETESVVIAGKREIEGNVRGPMREREQGKREKEKIGFCSGAQTNPTWTGPENEAASEKKETEGRRGSERQLEREERRQGVAGNKRLANPSCQFNLASNPGEMLIRASLPFLPFFLPSAPAPYAASPPFRCLFPVSRTARRACANASARAGNDTLFSRKDTAASPSTTWKLCAKRAAPVVFLSRSPFIQLLARSPAPLHPPPSLSQRPLSAFHPRNLSRLCSGLAVESVPADKGSSCGKILPLPAGLYSCNAIVAIRSLARPSASPRTRWAQEAQASDRGARAATTTRLMR